MMFLGFCVSPGYTFLCVGFMHRLFPRSGRGGHQLFQAQQALPC